MRKREITIKNFAGHDMIKISRLPTNGKPVKRVAEFPAEFIKSINDEVASAKNMMEEGTAVTIAEIKKLKKHADKVEMCEFAITTAEQLLKKTQEYKKEVLSMLPPPMAERNRRMADSVIAHQKSAIARFKKEMTVK